MEIENTSNNEEHFRKEYRVSWVGYFKFIAVNFVLSFIGLSLDKSSFYFTVTIFFTFA